MSEFFVGKLDISWENLKEVSIYGFGKASHGNIDDFINQFYVKSIIDNKKEYQGQEYRGIPVISFDLWLEGMNDEKIIIIAAGKALYSIRETLIKSGRKEFADFSDMDTFVNEWYWRFKRQVCIGKVTTSVTTACTFNCQYCNMLMPYYKTPHYYDYHILCEDADKFFELVDHVTSFVIIGGEPLLYKEIGAYLKFLGSKFGTKIANIQLITNGSILPSYELIQIIKKNNVEVRVSDYTGTIPYGERYKEFIELLKKNSVKYIVFRQDEWMDFGFPHEHISMGETKEELKEHMLNCHGMCHWLHSGKYYYCSSAWSANECGLFNLQEGDYLVLDELLEDPEKGKEQLMKFHMGELKNGYMSLCKYCRGFGIKNDKTVKAGIQIKRK